MRVESNISAVVAALDLRLVRLIRDAIADDPPSLHDPRRYAIEPRLTVEPEPEFLPRPTITPDPAFEPRWHVTPEPEIGPRPVQSAAPVESEQPCRANNPIEPPWARVPWNEPIPVSPPSPPRVKPPPGRPDTVFVGRLVDLMA